MPNNIGDWKINKDTKAIYEIFWRNKFGMSFLLTPINCGGTRIWVDAKVLEKDFSNLNKRDKAVKLLFKEKNK